MAWVVCYRQSGNSDGPGYRFGVFGWGEEGIPQGLKPTSLLGEVRAKPEGLAYLDANRFVKIWAGQVL